MAITKNSPLRAIRAKCIDCCGGQLYEVNKCAIDTCPLWAFRRGHRPKAQIPQEDAQNLQNPQKSGGYFDKKEGL